MCIRRESVEERDIILSFSVPYIKQQWHNIVPQYMFNECVGGG